MRPAPRVPALGRHQALTAVRQDEYFVRLVNRLARVQVDDAPVGQEQAEDMLAYLWHGVQRHLADELAERINARGIGIRQMRQELDTIWGDVQQLLTRGGGTVTETQLVTALRPARVREILRNLDRAHALYVRTASAEGVEVFLEDVVKRAETHRVAAASHFYNPRLPGGDMALLDEVDKDLVRLRRWRDAALSDQRKAELNDEIEELATYRKELKRELEELTRGPRRPGVRAQDRALRAAARAARLGAVDDPVRAVVEPFAARWVANSMPTGTFHGVRRVDQGSWANHATFDAFAELDPYFCGRGYELLMGLPSGTVVQPDGIQFLRPDGSVYRFLEHKEVYDLVNSYYMTGEGRDDLMDMLARHARIANEARGSGCAGFRYRTGHPDLDAFLEAHISLMQKRKFPGADLLDASPWDR